ncbi:hypothetical protein NDA12_000765 [Ustilago hordei]|nr:hypothetical protein NDA12_000765 [Ustilago hordei]KAJ1592522.1 hypothetical protein NDA15_004555 [Ustilago hordei]
MAHCYQMKPTPPDMEYLGDGAPGRQPLGAHQAEHAHLTVANGYGLGFVCANDQLTDPTTSEDWVSAMADLWCLPN